MTMASRPMQSIGNGASQSSQNIATLSCGCVEVELLGTQTTHHRVEDTELERCESPNHHASCPKTLGAELDHTRLFRDVEHAAWDRAITTSTSLVHLGQKCVSWVRNDRRHHPSDNTRAERHACVQDRSALCGRGAHVVVH